MNKKCDNVKKKKLGINCPLYLIAMNSRIIFFSRFARKIKYLELK